MTELARRPDDYPEHIGQQSIAELSAVFTWKRSRSYLFIGFDSQGRPAAVDSEAMLTTEAAECFRNGKRAGLDIMQIPHTDVTPMAYQYLAGKANYRGSLRRRGAIDLLQLSVIDSTGSTQVITVGETSLLSGMVQSSRHVWENSVRLSDQQRSGETLAMYSALVESPDDSRSGYVLLFQPPMKGVSNEAAYTQFVQEVLKSLVQMEAGQTSREQKGYIASAKKMLEQARVDRDDGLFIQLLEMLGVIRPIDAKPKSGGLLSNLAVKLLTREVPRDEQNQALMDSIDVQSRIATLGNNIPALIRMAEAFYDRVQR